VGPERGPLSLVSTNEQLLGTKSSGSDLEIRNTAVEIRCADNFYPKRLTLTSSTSGGRLVGIVRLRTQATRPLSVRDKYSKLYPANSSSRYNGSLDT
jgi:hypothetical protein